MALPDWPRAYGEPPVTAVLRTSPADFYVEEILGFEPDGQGEHCWLWIEKENLNTVDASLRLARFAGLRERDISYSGLKDKVAIARQWFCLYLLNRTVDWSAWQDPALRILRVGRHSKKLRRGTHRSNRFVIVLRDVHGDATEFSQRIEQLARDGVPNYFGEQRFGRDGRNIDFALRLYASGARKPSRQQASMYLSAARSLLFNEVLATRIRAANWLTPLPGDVMMLNRSNSVFIQPNDAELQQRLREGDIHPTGPLYGKTDGLAVSGIVETLERTIFDAHTALIEVLDKSAVESARRALRYMPDNLTGECVADSVWRISFDLPKGCFATSLVRELAHYTVQSSYS
ncbi:MAG: tRNA pseudouridine(13) synthase TruD [Verrucomicrobiaceae bacterium]|nr:tRNA pseudouridine(13) synthase TruD [Verrucomicrobiaceae bacterium]